jgi:hypothetical protein
VHADTAFLDLLNASPATAAHWRNILPEAERDPDLWQFSPRVSREAQQLFQQHIGTWIGSGFQRDGSEVPEKRTYATEGGLAIFRSIGGLLNSFEVQEDGRATLGLQAKNSKQEPLRISHRIWFDPRGGIRFDPVVWRRALKPEELAALGFFYFWDSGQLFTIVRCANAKCGVFAFRPNDIERYVHGWHCLKHSKNAAALRSAAKARQDERDKWLPRIPEIFLRYEARNPKPREHRSVWIRNEINRKLSRNDRIERHRITSIGKLFDANKAAGMGSAEAINDAVAKYKQPKNRGRKMAVVP